MNRVNPKNIESLNDKRKTSKASSSSFGSMMAAAYRKWTIGDRKLKTAVYNA